MKHADVMMTNSNLLFHFPTAGVTIFLVQDDSVPHYLPGKSGLVQISFV